ncbi:Bacteriocin class II with double-glycine leader peptide [Streptococcus infantarius subsp. infantarius]|nr:Bacteriocin class II with double-glycine leader peptide [Streptococcus infantarius subsp. infantarius CJ18]MCO4489155.1 Bacteriocin class II with double-glycine leader peptide [Streptococcus infantarius subsp. infantarius]MCO4489324.1 Bacteriocin class II with double-glycine leader peptide [Streptococcus infantarius subsp. infantarius]MCO4491299.1 Bacteriocin class II with double-glycine leader peptide [Streptococcus infantarius subsp. infantarius]MCO4507689.1 Bacteriocin class II with doubl
MNTKAFEQFDAMTDAELSTVEGGKSKEGRNMGCILGTAGMAGAGFLVAGPAGAAALGGATALRVCR